MRIELGCAELGVAWQVAKLPAPPAIFAVRGCDRRADDISLTRLGALGLIDAHGAVHPRLQQSMSVFAHAAVEVDLRFAAGRGAEVRAAVTAHEGVAILAVVTNGHVRFSRMPAETALPALVNVLPPAEPARGTLVSLPVAEVDAAITRSMEHHSGQDSDDCVVGDLTARGMSGTDARLFVSLVGSKRLRFAEFGVTVRDRAGVRHRGSGTVQAVDMRRGRAVLYMRGEYLVAAPADQHTLARVLTRLRDAELDRIADNG
ncbi:MAG TPA: ESX secretion-associated protein EspG [Pseudonocardiaceae bacterium]|nr:ESX secretion-associated protein EspG [Pseudonocardiaceae bacterium]